MERGFKIFILLGCLHGLQNSVPESKFVIQKVSLILVENEFYSIVGKIKFLEIEFSFSSYHE